jgi:hypothetical protein
MPSWLARNRKPYVAMSTKNLAKVSAWVNANAQHPLTRAYRGACTSLGDYQHLQVFDALCAAGLNHRRSAWTDSWGVQIIGFEYRDRIGRLILALAERAP